MPAALKRLDDKVLGDRLKGAPRDEAGGSPPPYPGDEDKAVKRPEPAAGKAEGKAEGKAAAKPSNEAEAKPATKAQSKPAGKPASKPGGAKPEGTSAKAAASKGVDLIVKVVRTALLLLALIVVAGIVLALVPTNPENSVVQFVNDTARTLAGPFKDVFVLSSPKKTISANYGLAAVVYLVLASVVGKLRSVVT